MEVKFILTQLNELKESCKHISYNTKLKVVCCVHCFGNSKMIYSFWKDNNLYTGEEQRNVEENNILEREIRVEYK